MRVRDIAAGPFISIRSSEHVAGILKKIIEARGPVFLRDENGEVSGLVNDRAVLDFLGGGSRHQIFVSGKGMNTKASRIAEEAIPVSSHMRAWDALHIIRKHGNSLYPVISGGRTEAALSEIDFLRTLKEESGISVEDAMTKKPFSIDYRTPISEASRIMCRGGFSKLPVTNNGVLLGIITPREVLLHLYKENRIHSLKKENEPVSSAMIRDVVSVAPETDIYEAAALMREQRIGVIPVTDEGELSGVLSRRDVLDALA